MVNKTNNIPPRNKDIDKIYSGKPIEEIQNIIYTELMSTGLFKEIVFNDSSDTDITIEPSLTRMEWKVPNYGQMQGKAFAAGAFTGLVGGMIYGSTKTDVYGDTSLYVKIVENDTGKIIIDKEYEGHCEEKMAKLNCDSTETKAKMVGNSLKKALEALKVDLNDAVDKYKNGNV